MNHLNFRRQQRKSMLGTRNNARAKLATVEENTNTDLNTRGSTRLAASNVQQPVVVSKPVVNDTRSNDTNQDALLNRGSHRFYTRSVALQEKLLLPNKVDLPSLRQENMSKKEGLKKKATDENSAEKVLELINSLLEENAQKLKIQLQQRERLRKINEILSQQLNLEDTFSDYEMDNNNENAHELAPQDNIIEEMRSTLSYLKTPRQSRVTRKSTILTPHSMSFYIQKQYKELVN